ncbi:MAG: hypothetical protein ACR2PZ_22390 [Pseudomonadales bacterium]
MVDGGFSIEAARALWADCERQLYPMAVSDSVRYQRVIVAVRALADEMRSVTSIEQLLTTWPTADELLMAAVSAHGLAASGLPREQVAGAAFALREREIREQSDRQARQERIEAARRAGDMWVLLDESGNVNSGLIDPYRSTDMHVASGLAVMALVQPDPSDGEPRYVVAVIQLDPLSGQLLDATPGIEDWMEHARQEDFAVHRETIRNRIISKASSADDR